MIFALYTVLYSKIVDLYQSVHVAVYLQQYCMLIHVIVYETDWVFKYI